MIGTGLKKLAAENGMKVSKGVAYGAMKGYTTTMNEGKGYKRIIISTRFPDAAQKDALLNKVRECDVRREFRVTSLKIAMNGIVVIFHDDPGTMSKIKAFIDWFYPLLPEFSASGDNICPECGLELTGGCWKLVNGMAVHVHNGCAQSLENKIDVKNENRKSESNGSYGSGLVGAFIGAAIGAIIWAIVLNFGFVASIIGFVIGWLAEKGYNLLRGKQGKGKIVILIFAIIFGVLLGTFAADFITLAGMLNAGEIVGSYGDIPGYILYLLVEDSAYMIAVLKNIGMGLLFAGLGVFSLLVRAGNEVADDKIIDLE